MNSSVEKILFCFGPFYNYNSLFISYPFIYLCLWLRRCKETSVFAGAHLLSHFFCIFSCLFLRNSRHLLCFQFPAMPYFCPQKLSTSKICFRNNFSLLVLLQQYNFFSICPIWFPFRHFFIFNSHIQTHPTLNVYPHKVIKLCIIYIEKLK